MSVANFMLIKLGKYQKLYHGLQLNLIDSTYLEVVVTLGPRNTLGTFLVKLNQHFHRSTAVLYSMKDLKISLSPLPNNQNDC